jgi:lauroyl/myristoyl acyltransferase
MTGFRWSAANKGIGLLYGVLIGVVFLLPRSWLLASGTGIALLAGVYSLKKLCALVPLERMPRLAQRCIVFLRLASPSDPG